MPNRIIRRGFVDSERVCALSDWTHRVYSNLLIECDDAGRFDGRVEVLRSRLFPLGSQKRSADFEAAISELENSGLVIRYAYDNRPILQVLRWQRCGKAENSKYPWKDGSFTIPYVTFPTSEGPKGFVATSIARDQHPVSMGSTPHADGVTTNPNTETETYTKAETQPDTAAADSGIWSDALKPARDFAFKAFGQWSACAPPVGRSKPIMAEHGEDVPIATLIFNLSQCPPVPRGNEPVARHLLVPQAVEALMAKKKDFRKPAWACGCVKNELDDWAKGYGASTKAQNPSRKSSNKPMIDAC